MMLQRHYDEEALIAILHSGEAASRDEHIADCIQCSDLLDSYRVMAEVLGEGAVWDLHEAHQEEAAAKGAAALRAFATSMASDDAQAATLIDELIVAPRQWWVATVARDERYHTAGVIRRLVEVSEAKVDTMPPDAVELAAAAITVADGIEGGEELKQLRGAAYRQHGYALFYVGEFIRALESVDRSEQIFA
jgi:hypothetical protein